MPHRRTWPCLLGRLVSIGFVFGCSGTPPDAGEARATGAAVEELSRQREPSSCDSPVGLAFEIENGVGKPLRLRAGQRFYVNQIDLRSFVDTDVDEGLRGVRTSGDFAGLDWTGTQEVDREFVGLANADGTLTLRRFFRGAAWMERSSSFVVTQVDARGLPTAEPWTVDIGTGDHRRDHDAFFVRRLRAIQWVLDCPSKTSCDGATEFREEGLVEVRNTRFPDRTERLSPRTTALQVRWLLHPTTAYRVPVEQVRDPEFDYGFDIGVRPVTPPGAGGVYAPGTAVTFELTLRDGSGNRLHAPGELPTYDEVVLQEANEAGIDYYRAFFDPTTTYYRRKHRERMLMAQIIGPAQSIQAVRSIIDLDAFLDPSEDSQVTATPARDGVFAEFQTFPRAADLFGGAFDPTHDEWFANVSDTFTFHVPPDARPGTYLVTVKGRRTYLGEDIPQTRTIELQVGSATPTHAVLGTGPCNTCHSGPGDLGTVLHANANRAACAGCHVPLGFELEGPIFVRTHFIHARSGRFDAPLFQCSKCHLTEASIERTSKAACLSCHKSYPNDHVARYGPIESMYIGGGRESFDRCSTTCHTTHPGAAF